MKQMSASPASPTIISAPLPSKEKLAPTFSSIILFCVEGAMTWSKKNNTAYKDFRLGVSLVGEKSNMPVF